MNEEEKEIESNDVLTKSNNEKETRKECSDIEHSKSTENNENKTQISSFFFAEHMMTGLRDLKAQSAAKKKNLIKKKPKLRQLRRKRMFV